ncbi:MAG: septal ring lytic transglycosylase RlpA family protein [Candidatus Peribacteraceae bacterium]|nr:septal ring lytic transglycosylase RlpA family protein [Candidatus Peribacteraceae bacterium]MBP9850067.1 septal ring lytic transglycosylase RlpA family protein [Candidatus Peribacteraceae bacterium]
MKRLTPALIAAAFLVSIFPAPVLAADAVTRRDGFVLIWRSTSRPAEKTNEPPYADVPKSDAGYPEITYAKARGLLDDSQENFYPDSPMTPSDALRWIFRTRSVEPIDEHGDRVLSKLPEPEQVPALAAHYDISYDAEGASMTHEQLLALMRQVDDKLQAEVHEVSLYSEKFHGKGTAFGEGFDMWAMTAAHRTFPGNTLVKVTNVENGKSVTVRINDRGPYVQGRDMDLSLGSFITIAERSEGKINATFERLGDSNKVQRCNDDRFQRRIVKDVILNPGIPHSFPLGGKLRLSSQSAFVVRNIVYPDGTHTGVETWITEGETFELEPSVTGLYRFMMGTKTGRVREMRMEVLDCSGA